MLRERYGPLNESPKDRRERLRREFSEDLARLHRKKFESVPRARSDASFQRQLDLLQEIHQHLHSQDFKAWYEATTREPVDEWLETFAISPSEFVQRHPYLGGDQLGWLRSEIEKIAKRNRWYDPEQRQYWTNELLSAADAHERRFILQKLATPQWADSEAIMAVYRERDRLAAESGIEHAVDHVIPVVHERVCGLHVAENLRAIPAHDNRRKSNRWNVD